MKKKIFIILIVFSYTILFTKTYKFKFHHFIPRDANISKNFITPWIEKIEKESKNEIAIEQFSSMQLGGTPSDLLRQLRDGKVDFVWTVIGYTPGKFPKAEAFELPFIATSSEATSQAFYEYYEENLLDEFRDYKVITVHTHGSGSIHTKKPIFNINDLQGRKIRVPTRITVKLLEGLGAVPIGLPISQINDFLTKELIDGALIPWGATLVIKSSDLVKNHTSVSGKLAFYIGTFVLAMSKESYLRLPINLQSVIDSNSGLEVAAWAGRVVSEEEKQGRDYARKLNNNFITVSPKETEKWKKISDKITKDWIQEMNQKGYNGEKLVQDAKTFINKYSP